MYPCERGRGAVLMNVRCGWVCGIIVAREVAIRYSLFAVRFSPEGDLGILNVPTVCAVSAQDDTKVSACGPISYL